MPTETMPATVRVGVLESAAKIVRAAEAARSNFVNREEAIEVLSLAWACGQHVMFFGPRGTAKSSLTRYFADVFGLKFARKLLNPDTTREDLFGALDIQSMLHDADWKRKLAALATSHSALLDELGRASHQVHDMLLDFLEERRTSVGDVDYELPIHVAVGATNSTLGQDGEALMDRFALRAVLHYIDTASDLDRLLSSTWATPPAIALTADELRELRATVRDMAANAPDDVRAKLVEMWADFPNVSESPLSDRRWKLVLIVAAGRALLYGRTQIEIEDLLVMRYMAWENAGDPEHVERVQRWVEEKVDPTIAEYREVETLVTDAERQIAQARSANDLEGFSRARGRTKKLLSTRFAGKNTSNWNALKARAQALLESDL